MSNEIFTVDDNNNAAVRTVSVKGIVESNKKDIFTKDENGNAAVRVVGGGGDSHNKGFFTTQEALVEAYPTGEDGDYAIVGATDTVWVWDSDSGASGAWVDTDTKGQVTSVNNQTGAVTVQETLVSGTNIKTIDGSSILGSGDLELSTYLPFPAGWTTSGTTKALCDDIAADTSAVKGKAYLGEVTCSDLPASMANAEIVAEIIDGTTSSNKVIKLTCSSGNTAPYMWIYTYWNGGTDVSGWVVPGVELPSQSGQSGKFLTTDGTDVSWGNALQNKATGDGLQITTDSTSYIVGSGNIVVGALFSSVNNIDGSTALGAGVGIRKGSTVIGNSARQNSGEYGTALGNGAYVSATGAIQLGVNGENNEAGTLKVSLLTQYGPGQWNNVNYKLLDYDGTIPTARLTKVNTTVTLAAADWSSNSQTVNVTGMTASALVFVAPAVASQSDYTSAGIICSAQGSGTLTFTCDTTPTNDITVNVVAL